jgi:tetratricopeptide (TPR) repeat protein
MVRFGKWLGCSLRAHPWLSLAALLLACLAAASTAHLWAVWRFHHAERAIATEQLDTARQDVAYCLRLWPRSPATYLLAARIERLAGNLNKAEEHIRTCRRLQGGSTEESQLATLLVRVSSGDLRDIEPGLWQCVEDEHPRSEEILEALAVAYTENTRYLSALRALSIWIERYPATPRARHWRGNIHEQVNLQDEAAEDYEQALEGMPWRWDLRLRLAAVQLRRLRPPLAWPHLEQLLREHSDSAEVLREAARYYLIVGDTKQARPLIEQALDAAPDDADALLLRGKLECQEGHLSEGEVWLRKALAIRPSDLDMIWELYRCLTRQPGRQKEAEKVHARHRAVEADQRKLRALAKSGTSEQTDPVVTAYEIGVLCLRLGREKQGLQALQLALDRDPQHRPTLEAFADYYEKIGEKQAAEHYRRLFEQAPRDGAGRPPGP